MNILIIASISIVVLVVIGMIVGICERKVIKEDIDFLYGEIFSFRLKNEIAKKEAALHSNNKSTECGTEMNASKYQRLAMRTNDGKCMERLLDKAEMIDFFKEAKGGKPCEKYDLGGIINASMGLSGEVGELNDFLKKWVFHGHEMDETTVKKEIGDACWYIALMCESFGFDLEDIMKMNIEKLQARYPEGFDTEKSIHRKEGDV